MLVGPFPAVGAGDLATHRIKYLYGYVYIEREKERERELCSEQKSHWKVAAACE